MELLYKCLLEPPSKRNAVEQLKLRDSRSSRLHSQAAVLDLIVISAYYSDQDGGVRLQYNSEQPCTVTRFKFNYGSNFTWTVDRDAGTLELPAFLTA